MITALSTAAEQEIPDTTETPSYFQKQLSSAQNIFRTAHSACEGVKTCDNRP